MASRGVHDHDDAGGCPRPAPSEHRRLWPPPAGCPAPGGVSGPVGPRRRTRPRHHRRSGHDRPACGGVYVHHPIQAGPDRHRHPLPDGCHPSEGPVGYRLSAASWRPPVTAGCRRPSERKGPQRPLDRLCLFGPYRTGFRCPCSRTYLVSLLVTPAPWPTGQGRPGPSTAPRDRLPATSIGASCTQSQPSTADIEPSATRWA